MFIAVAVSVYQNAGVKAGLSLHSRGITKTASESTNIPRLTARLIPCGQPGRHVYLLVVIFKLAVIAVRLQFLAGLESNRLT
jgi:hypothetical protein